jgi:Na+/H+ antiporter NhaD/arsenite permease-like protein
MVILLIIDNRNSIAKDLDCVEWTTLLFLSCVFIIIRGIVETGLIRLVASACVFYVEWGVTPVVTSLVSWFDSVFLSMVLTSCTAV